MYLSETNLQLTNSFLSKAKAPSILSEAIL